MSSLSARIALTIMAADNIWGGQLKAKKAFRYRHFKPGRGIGSQCQCSHPFFIWIGG